MTYDNKNGDNRDGIGLGLNLCKILTKELGKISI